MPCGIGEILIIILTTLIGANFEDSAQDCWWGFLGGVHDFPYYLSQTKNPRTLAKRLPAISQRV